MTLLMLNRFLSVAMDDPRISSAHIAVYAALIKLWAETHFKKPLSIFSRQVMPLCKISSPSTYHKTVRQLHEYGYIRYRPSFSRCFGSEVEFIFPEPRREKDSGPFKVSEPYDQLLCAK